MYQDLIRIGLGPLLHREQQVLAGVRAGLSNRQIGLQINVCEDTVKYHLKRIFLKLGVRRRSEAVAVAVYNGLMEGFDHSNGEAAAETSLGTALEANLETALETELGSGASEARLDC
jgi:DNA-binding CsgD family transcriptional regulator